MAKTGEKSKEEAKRLAHADQAHVREVRSGHHRGRHVPHQGWSEAQDDVLSQEVLRLNLRDPRQNPAQI